MRKNIDWSDVAPFIAKGDKSVRRFQWDTGDRILEKMGRPGADDGDDSRQLDNLAAILKNDFGVEYATTTLKQLRLMAYAFPPDRRRHELSFGVHADARDPDTLDAIINKAPPGQKIVQAYVREQMRAREVAHRREMEKEADRRRHNAEIAKKERDRAERDKASAKTIEDRKAAAERLRVAEQSLRKNLAPPKPGEVARIEPPKEAIPALVARSRYDVLVGKIQELTNELVEDHLLFFSDLSKAEMEHAVDAHLGLVEQHRKLADLARKDQGNKRGLLSVVA